MLAKANDTFFEKPGFVELFEADERNEKRFYESNIGRYEC